MSLNVLRHLGLGLYSNVAAVLSEVVANSWDADAEHVCISIDSVNQKIVIQDDGHGMTIDDANKKYLTVGYERRKADTASLTPRFKRPVMGRKGIGKLSLFSIARTVEVHSIKDNHKHGFKMDSDDIEKRIREKPKSPYFPDEIDRSEFELDRGTRITLTNLKRQLQWTGKPLRRRLARRFSIIGPQYNFEITLDGEPITIDDRDYHNKLQYIWTFGERGLRSRDDARKLEHSEARSNRIRIEGCSEYEIDGWIGTAFESKQLRDSDTKESINKIVVMTRGKLAQEDILEEFGEGGLYTKYIFGEIHANFLDLDDQDDIATTSRQRLIEEDPRYQLLKEKLLIELKHIQGKWTELRNLQGPEKALAYPQIEQWFRDLNPDHKAKAKKLFGRINQLTVDDQEQKRQLFISGVLAFESLKLRNLLYRLDEVSPKNLQVLEEVFIQLDDLEASAYFQIVKDRLAVIRKLTGLADDNAKECALQKHSELVD
ncbi:MAG: ATP-binding protein [Anaerolineaceae bacterium]|nr:ATP-binding protein [Anaerolineaceae bacterium]